LGSRRKQWKQLAGSVKLLWGEKGQTRPGPKPALCVEQIARAAVRVADKEGLAAISMQRIAREVHVTTMALYRYFSSKTELVELMIDIAGGPAPDLDAISGGWRHKLEEWTRRCSSIYSDHPWFLEATTARRRIVGPNEAGWLNSALAALADAGLSGGEQHEAFLILMGHVRSHAEFRAGSAKGLSVERWAAGMTDVLERHRNRYPALAAAICSGAFHPPRGDDLAFGLDCILDGIGSRLTKRRKRH
jgi:AcrR family transcriptional regulator